MKGQMRNPEKLTAFPRVSLEDGDIPDNHVDVWPRPTHTDTPAHTPLHPHARATPHPHAPPPHPHR